jgi:UDP-glucose 6-dehydrogenase
MNMEEKIKIGIIGIGVTGEQIRRWFEEVKGYQRGENLFCYDIDPKKGYGDDISKAIINFLCLPTPAKPDWICDTSIVEKVVAQLPDGDRAVVIRSTVPPLTTLNLQEKYRTKGDFFHYPEFLTESQPWEDFIRPDRQIIAAAEPKGRKWISAILNLLPIGSFQSPGVSGTYRFYEINSTEAELIKYLNNLFGYLKVLFGNIAYDLCESFGQSHENVCWIIGHDRRIGLSWLDPLYGDHRGNTGSCFSKDIPALINFWQDRIESLGEIPVKRRAVYLNALEVVKAALSYNDSLLDLQGFTREELCVHNAERNRRIAEKKEKAKCLKF